MLGLLLPLDPSSAGPAPVLSRNELFCSPAAAQLLAVNHPEGLTESISPSTQQGMMVQKEERIWFLKHAEPCLSQSIENGKMQFQRTQFIQPWAEPRGERERGSCSSAKPACAKQKHTQHSACRSCHGHSAFRTVQSPASEM